MMNCAKWKIPVYSCLIFGMFLLITAACGGGNESTGRTAVEVAVPTMPPARFTAVANQNTLPNTASATAASTTTISTTTTSTTTVSITTTSELSETIPAGTTSADSATVDTPEAADLERGARSYVKNNCAACHGEQGKGVADKGGAIDGTALSLQEFDYFLRTGGGLGAEHIFGPSAVSPGGMAYLHAYVQSLAGQ